MESDLLQIRAPIRFPLWHLTMGIFKLKIENYLVIASYNNPEIVVSERLVLELNCWMIQILLQSNPPTTGFKPLVSEFRIVALRKTTIVQ